MSSTIVSLLIFAMFVTVGYSARLPRDIDLAMMCHENAKECEATALARFFAIEESKESVCRIQQDFIDCVLHKIPSCGTDEVKRQVQQAMAIPECDPTTGPNHGVTTTTSSTPGHTLHEDPTSGPNNGVTTTTSSTPGHTVHEDPTSGPNNGVTTTTSSTPGPTVPDLCDGCLMENGIGYKSHWADCTKFIQCTFRPDGSTTWNIKACAHGTFWDQKQLACNHAHLVDCATDPTTGPNNGVTTTTSSTPGPTVPDVCDKRPVPNRPLQFEQYVKGHGWVLMTCAPGTAYNGITCQCSISGGPGTGNQQDCRPELLINFNNGQIKDNSGNNNYIQVDGVKVVGGAGYFDGDSLLRVPRFSNIDSGDTVVISLRYRQDVGLGGSVGQGRPGVQQALVANGDCNQASSLYMVTGDGGSFNVGLRTDSGRNVSVTIPGQSSGSDWNEAIMIVDKNVLLGSVNGVSHETLFNGTILSSKCALQIGRGSDFASFTGYMDDIAVYFCRPRGF